MKKIFLWMIAIAPLVATAQEKKISERQRKKNERNEKIKQLIKKEEEGALVFNKQGTFGIHLNTDGYGILYEHGKYKTITKTNLWWASLSERKNPKEQKFSTMDLGSGFIIGNPYIYGKINNFYNLKIGIGQQYLIGGKGSKNGVATTLIYGGGLALAMLKPYYLDVKDPTTGRAKSITYQDDPALFLNSSYIIGSSGFGKGFNKMQYIPGAQARFALRFDYGRYNEVVSALEVGLNAEFYSKKIEHMAFNDPKNFFYNAYLAIVFGRRK